MAAVGTVISVRGAVCLVVSGVLAGCGGSDAGRQSADMGPLSRDQYQAGMLAARDHAGDATRLWDEMVVAKKPQPECERLIRRFYAAVDSGVRVAAALKPPREIAEAHARFIAAARTSVSEVARVADSVESGKIGCGRELNHALYGMRSTEDAQAALADIERAGIPLGRQ